MRKLNFSLALLIASLPLSLVAQAPSLAIQVDHPTAKVSPMLYGLMTEEINFSYDGGIYAEMVRDRDDGRRLERSLFHWLWSSGKHRVQDVNRPSERPQQGAAAGPEDRADQGPKRAGRCTERGLVGHGVSSVHHVQRIVWAKTDGLGPLTVSLVTTDGQSRSLSHCSGLDERVEAIQLCVQDRRPSGLG